jgi:transcriptional regulator GlxA family with amidase domain
MRGGDLSLPSAALRIGISARSLQRHLEGLNITYSDLVDEVRFDVARSLLVDSSIEIAEIGASLGYRDPSSFSRAFMRWSGTSPRDYRLSFRAPFPAVT